MIGLYHRPPVQSLLLSRTRTHVHNYAIANACRPRRRNADDDDRRSSRTPGFVVYISDVIAAATVGLCFYTVGFSEVCLQVLVYIQYIDNLRC